MNSIIYQIIECIKQYDNIIIHGHQSPDPDSIGSQGGLAEIIKYSFPYKNVYKVGTNHNSLNWISGEDNIKDDVYSNALVIVVDCANASRIDDQRYSQGSFLIKIDHHPSMEQYANINLINLEASSVSEMIVDITNESNGILKLNKKSADMLYAGIIGDTGRFMYSNTTEHTLKITSQLFIYSIDAFKINRNLDEINLNIAKLSAYIWNNMIITPHNAAYIVLKKQLLDKYNITSDNTSQLVPVMGHISSILCWTLFSEKGDGSYRLNIRSKGPTINNLAEEYNGGGHRLASGARIDHLSDEILQNYVKKLDNIAARFIDGEVNE